MAKQYVIFLDIDGTLCPRGSSVPPASAVEAIVRARQNGHRIFLSSGRSMTALAPLLDYGFDGVIACAGGHVELDGQVLYDCPMAEGVRDGLLRVTEEHHILRVLECDGDSYGNVPPFPSGISQALGDWYLECCQMLRVQPLAHYRGEKVYKLVFLADRMEQLEPLRQVAEADFRFVYQMEHPYVLGEMIHRSFHKGQGVRQICQALGAQLADTICVGDSMNDWEMMEVAGVSVCMGNGDPKLKEICQQVCPKVEEDGLYHAFRHLGLI